MRIRVYFVSGFAADFDRDKVTFGKLSEWLQYKTDDGRTIINADTVCYVKELEDQADDDE